MTDIYVQAVGAVEDDFVMGGRLWNHREGLSWRIDLLQSHRCTWQPGQGFDSSIGFMQNLAQKSQIAMLVQVMFKLGLDQIVRAHART